MYPEGSLLHLQVPVTCPYPEPDHSSPLPKLHNYVLYILPVIDK
jgi:hypothetical protein